MCRAAARFLRPLARPPQGIITSWILCNYSKTPSPPGRAYLSGVIAETPLYFLEMWRVSRFARPLAMCAQNRQRSLPLGNIRKPPAVDEVEMVGYRALRVSTITKNVRNYYIVKFYGFLTPHPSRPAVAPPSPPRGRLLHAADLYMLVQSGNLPPIAQ